MSNLHMLCVGCLALGASVVQDEVVGLVVERPEGPALVIPRAEVLDYNVRLDMAVVGMVKVGNFRLTASVAPFQAGLPTGSDSADTPADGGEVGRILAEAWGEHLGYTLEHAIEMTWQPLDWPRIVYRDVQKGSENRRRELRYGVLEGQPKAWYQSDRHCSGCEREEHFLEGTWFRAAKHCQRCKRAAHRVWREPQVREVPAGALDMLGAVYVARQMVRDGVQRTTFPLLDREDTWEVELTQGRKLRRTVPAGVFACSEMRLKSRVPGADEREFEGLFGIQGTISIWMEQATGVPVEISGTVPLGPLKLEVSIGLASFAGTPEPFGKE